MPLNIVFFHSIHNSTHKPLVGTPFFVDNSVDNYGKCGLLKKSGLSIRPSRFSDRVNSPQSSTLWSPKVT